mmetsp:Transcript_113831/g.317936  ORF Transcript_113831/g.317936 Transcript_113831/m.317936 type:complete len:272 (+) Transcript_113831:148-963(+)
MCASGARLRAEQATGLSRYAARAQPAPLVAMSSSRPTILATRPRQTGHWKLHVEDVIVAQLRHRQTCLQCRIATSRGLVKQMTQSPPSASLDVGPSIVEVRFLGFGKVPYNASKFRTTPPHRTLCFTSCTPSPSSDALNTERCTVMAVSSTESARRSRTTCSSPSFPSKPSNAVRNPSPHNKSLTDCCCPTSNLALETFMADGSSKVSDVPEPVVRKNKDASPAAAAITKKLRKVPSLSRSSVTLPRWIATRLLIRGAVFKLSFCVGPGGT